MTLNSSTLMSQLRLATEAAHRRLHRVVDVEAMVSSRENYTAALRAYHAILTPLEQALLKSMIAQADRPPQWAERWRKVSWLEADLHAMGVEPEVIANQPPVISSIAQMVGITYVTEGLTLGGTGIAKQLRRSSWTGKSLRFFGGYGEQTGPRWQAYRHWVEHSGAEPEASIASANATFDRFEKGLSGPFQKFRAG